MKLFSLAPGDTFFLDGNNYTIVVFKKVKIPGMGRVNKCQALDAMGKNAYFILDIDVQKVAMGTTRLNEEDAAIRAEALESIDHPKIHRP